MRNFENWDTQDLETIFGLVELEEMNLLELWLASKSTLSIPDEETVQKLKKSLKNNVDFWNEDELKLQFIAPLLMIVDFNMPNYKIFSQRPMSAKINGIEIGGRVDFVLAKGKQKPTNPYFFIHEYKHETKRGSGDPKGQLLSEMLVAQAKNENKMPVYGCYVLGRSWFL
jgi:hypothetical protein